MNLLNNSDSNSGKVYKVQVCVRIRPSSENDSNLGIVSLISESCLALRPLHKVNYASFGTDKTKVYNFDKVFGPAATQEDVYSFVCKSLISNLISGRNSTIFAYGVTSTGKTYTMFGNEDTPGLVSQCFHDIFSQLQSDQSVYVAFYEIYNESIYDLLDPSSGVADVRATDTKGGQKLVGIRDMPVMSYESANELLNFGLQNRQTQSTKNNHSSSRSHAIMRITVLQRAIREEGIFQNVGVLNLVDLAGSEALLYNYAVDSRIKEGRYINKSLLALSSCINALILGQRARFRDSKLTRLLKDSFTGSCQTVMVAHVSPDVEQYQQTHNTLVYAAKTKGIKTKLYENAIPPVYLKQREFEVAYRNLSQEVDNIDEKLHENDATQFDLQQASIVTQVQLRHTEQYELTKRLLDDRFEALKSLKCRQFLLYLNEIEAAETNRSNNRPKNEMRVLEKDIASVHKELRKAQSHFLVASKKMGQRRHAELYCKRIATELELIQLHSNHFEFLREKEKRLPNYEKPDELIREIRKRQRDVLELYCRSRGALNKSIAELLREQRPNAGKPLSQQPLERFSLEKLINNSTASLQTDSKHKFVHSVTPDQEPANNSFKPPPLQREDTFVVENPKYAGREDINGKPLVAKRQKLDNTATRRLRPTNKDHRQLKVPALTKLHGRPPPPRPVANTPLPMGISYAPSFQIVGQAKLLKPRRY